MKDFKSAMGVVWGVLALIFFMIFIASMADWSYPRWIIPTSFGLFVFAVITCIACFVDSDD